MSIQRNAIHGAVVHCDGYHTDIHTQIRTCYCPAVSGEKFLELKHLIRFCDWVHMICGTPSIYVHIRLKNIKNKDKPKPKPVGFLFIYLFLLNSNPSCMSSKTLENQKPGGRTVDFFKKQSQIFFLLILLFFPIKILYIKMYQFKITVSW